MAELSIDLNWYRTTTTMVLGEYETAHDISFNEDCSIRADAAPDWGGDPEAINPEQSLAAALSSCHMMTFLNLAARTKWPVATYHDHALAALGKLPNGRMAVTDITLTPRVTFDSGFTATEAEMEKMHLKAHKLCFVANSISAKISINPII